MMRRKRMAEDTAKSRTGATCILLLLSLLREFFRLWRKSLAGFLGFTQTHEGAALDPRRDFVPFETHSGGSLV